MAKVYKIIVCVLLVVGTPVFAYGATLSISPSGSTSQVGDLVTVRIVVTSDSNSINAVSTDVLFPPSIFSVQSVAKNGSILNFWVTEPSFKKASGVVHLEGVALNGFQGSSGTVLTVTLKAVSVGSGKVTFQTGQVLANDGQGTDVTGAMTGGTFTVKEATKKPDPKPEPEPTVEPEVEQPLLVSNAPEITSGTKYGAMSVVGTSDYPKSDMVVTFLANNGVKVFISGTSDEDGSFNLVVPGSLKSGSYSVSAVAVKNDKSNSKTSNIIQMKIGNVFFELPSWAMLLSIVLILLLIYLILRVLHHFGNSTNKSKAIRHKVDNAEKVARKSFEILRDDIHEYEGQKLSVAEHKIIAEIKKDITDAEKFITKEIKDIESI